MERFESGGHGVELPDGDCVWCGEASLEAVGVGFMYVFVYQCSRASDQESFAVHGSGDLDDADDLLGGIRVLGADDQFQRMDAEKGYYCFSGISGCCFVDLAGAVYALY